jgi:two-component system, NarL family, nitrate/nitrite response regulator NarL
VSVAVLAQNSLFRFGLVTLLATFGFESVMEASTIGALKQLKVDDGGVDIVLVHLCEETAALAQLMREINEWSPRTKVVFLCPKLDLRTMGDCFAAGASGYLLENLSRDALQPSLTLVRIGEKIFPSELAGNIVDLAGGRGGDPNFDEREVPDLSQREGQILRSLARGESNKAIATRLNIAESTVKVHLKHILRKIRATNRTQAALWAVRHAGDLRFAVGSLISRDANGVSSGGPVPATADQRRSEPAIAPEKSPSRPPDLAPTGAACQNPKVLT